MMREFTVKGIKFTTLLLQDQAVQRLKSRKYSSERDRDFARSLVRSAEGRGLSPRQEPWFYWLAEEQDKQPQQEEAVPDFAAMKLIAMVYLPKVQGKLKKPVVRLKEGDCELKLSIASQTSKFPGDIWVASGDGRLLGRIDHTNGKVHVRSDAAVNLLHAAEQDPENLCRAYGRNTGHCCFCAKELTRKVSIDVGYGPICAERFGLWHADQEGDVRDLR